MYLNIDKYVHSENKPDRIIPNDICIGQTCVINYIRHINRNNIIIYYANCVTSLSFIDKTICTLLIADLIIMYNK